MAQGCDKNWRSLVDEEYPLNTPTAINLLEDAGFKFTRYWDNLACRLLVPLEIRKQHEQKAMITLKFKNALENCIDYWMANHREVSWEKFIECVKKVDQPVATNIVAILNNTQSKEIKTVSSHFNPDLAIEILDAYEVQLHANIDQADLQGIIEQLIGEDVLPGSVLDELKRCHHAEDGKKILFSEVRKAIKIIPRHFEVFAYVLKSFVSPHTIGNLLLSEYFEVSQHFNDDQTLSLSHGTSSVIEVPLSPTFESELDKLRGVYGSMFISVMNKILKKNIPSCKLKQYLSLSYKELDPEIAHLDSVENIMMVVNNHCSLTNISCMEQIVNEFKIEDAMSDISTYKENVDVFCNNTVINVCMHQSFNKYFRKPLKCETIKFTLDWDHAEKKLSHINILLKKAFELYVKEVHVVVIDPGNSITITCYAPRDLMSILAIKVRGNLDFLEEMGVMSLSIGHYVILDHKTKDKAIESLKERIMQLEDSHHEVEVVVKPQSTPHIQESMLESRLKDTEECLRKKESELKDLEKFLHSSLLSSPDEQGKLAANLFDKNNALSKEMEMLKLNHSNMNSRFEIVSSQLKNTQEAFDLVKERVTMLENVLLDRDKELELQQTCLTEKDRLLQQLQQKVTEQSEVTTNEEKVKEIKEKLELKENELAMVKKMSKVKDARNRDLEERAKNAAAIIQEKQSELAKQEEEKTKEIQLIREQAAQVAALRIPSASHSWTKPLPPPVDLPMTNFTKHKKIDDYWESPPFLSHPEGYKICVRVRANGCHVGRGTHVSVYVHLMQGEYDDMLSWPFKGIVKLGLMNHKEDSDHFEKTFTFDKSSEQRACERVLDGVHTKSGIASSEPVGYARFIAHEDLLPNSEDKPIFLDEEDTLRFRVLDVTLLNEEESVVLQSSPKPLPSSIYEFVMEGFSKKKKTILFSSDWDSPPFYSHMGGHKFVLVVFANGKRKAQGRSVSVYVHLARGENDSSLKFPFRGNIIVELINCLADDNHCQQVVTFSDDTDPNGERGGRVWLSSRAYHGLGVHDFIAHKDLSFNAKRNTQYLDDNDCLRFRILKVESL